jgi:PTH1 family peptidyl-tRNA hydrolase
MSETYLIVGLGNPGREYANTRHNIGFRCVDALAARHGLVFDDKKRSKARIALGSIQERRVLLAKPQTYMNLSGGAVQGLAAFYRVLPAQVMVIFDDLDLPVGTLRIRPKGGAGGHKGVTDIIHRLGTQDFPRIRVGIGRPNEQMDPSSYVLRPFDGQDEEEMARTVERVLLAVETWLSAGIDLAMSRCNGSADEVARRAARLASPDAPPPANDDERP